ncbi:conserved exported hypothetical protein [Tenacibaculum sp. 190524A02b]|uniref:Peptidase S9 prolyl oligopeptidase catalytic domain-containing protein n=1 Tax=Tenacibaculum vairaonense TaxID=3137860 RepID=A0ABP1F8S3_9FLAO
MKKLRLLRIYLILATNSIFLACTSPSFNPSMKSVESFSSKNLQYLIKANLIGKYSLTKLKPALIKHKDFPSELIDSLKYGLKVYKITYYTEYLDGRSIVASGAVIIPDTSETLDMISYQHGTIIDNREAPSNFTQSIVSYVSPCIFASIGYITVLPDYIGYGSSSSFPHPYEHGESLATASRDMIRATREFIEKKNKINVSKKLFLSGYSEGASATMALHQLLQEKHPDEFTVTANSSAAGAYDKKAFLEATMSKDKQLNFLNYYIWVLDTYNKIYSINLSYSDIYKAPFNSVIETEGVFANLSSQNPKDIFKESFINNIKNGTETKMINAMKANSYYNFVSNSPIQLVHGTKDNFVPFYNAKNTYDTMIANGVDITLKKIKKGNHSNISQQYNLETITFFKKF